MTTKLTKEKMRALLKEAPDLFEIAESKGPGGSILVRSAAHTVLDSLSKEDREFILDLMKKAKDMAKGVGSAAAIELVFKLYVYLERRETQFKETRNVQRFWSIKTNRRR